MVRVARRGRVVVGRGIVGDRSGSMVHFRGVLMVNNRLGAMVHNRRRRMVIQGGKCRFGMVHR